MTADTIKLDTELYEQKSVAEYNEEKDKIKIFYNENESDIIDNNILSLLLNDKAKNDEKISIEDLCLTLTRAYNTIDYIKQQKDIANRDFFQRTFTYISDFSKKLNPYKKAPVKKQLYTGDYNDPKFLGDLKDIADKILKVFSEDNLKDLAKSNSQKQFIFFTLQELVKNNTSAKDDLKNEVYYSESYYKANLATEAALVAKNRIKRNETTFTLVTSAVTAISSYKLWNDFIDPIIKAPHSFMQNCKDWWAGKFSVADIFMGRGQGAEVRAKVLGGLLYLTVLAVSIFSLVKSVRTIQDSKDDIREAKRRLADRDDANLAAYPEYRSFKSDNPITKSFIDSVQKNALSRRDGLSEEARNDAVTAKSARAV